MIVRYDPPRTDEERIFGADATHQVIVRCNRCGTEWRTQLGTAGTLCRACVHHELSTFPQHLQDWALRGE